MILVDQPTTLAIATPVPPMAEGSSSVLKSPPQKITTKQKGQKWSLDMPIITEVILVEAGAVVLSSAFETAEEDQEEEDELRLCPHSTKKSRSQGPVIRYDEGTHVISEFPVNQSQKLLQLVP